MVNVELDSFLGFSNQGEFDELCIKHIILNLANCFEKVKIKLQKFTNNFKLAWRHPPQTRNSRF